MVATFSRWTTFTQILYRHVFPAPVDRTSVSAWLYKNPWVTSTNKPNTSMTRVACESKFSCEIIHAVGCAVVYYAWAANAFSAEMLAL